MLEFKLNDSMKLINKPIHLALLISLFIYSTGCRSSRPSANANKDTLLPTLPELPLDSLLTHIMAAQNIQLLSMKGEIEYENKNENLDAKISLYSMKDSFCLLILKKLGIEVSRILITKDSIQIIDRLNQEYITGIYNNLIAYYQVPFPFYAIHDILTNVCFFSEDILYQASIKENNYIIKGFTETQACECKIHGRTLKPLSFSLNTQAYAMNIQSEERSQILWNAIPTKMKISIHEKLNPQEALLDIHIHWTDIKFEIPKTIKFNIPDHYLKRSK